MRAIYLSLMLMIASCTSVPTPDPQMAMVNAYNLGNTSIEDLEREVEVNHNPEAALKLAEYYFFALNDDPRAGEWYKKAAQYGGREYKDAYKSYLEE